MEKPGYKTTEFWLTLLTGLLSLAMSVGWIDADGNEVVAAFVTSAIALWRYIDSRAKVKAK